jgi:hypothetical protein
MKPLTNLIIDTTVFLGFLLVNEPKITNQTIHEWLGLAVFVTLLVHLILHWKWVVNKVLAFFKKMAIRDRVNLIVDFIFFIAIITVTLTGVLMSKSALPALGISVGHSGTWKQLHSLSADACLYALALHFALHWSWITAAFKRYIIQPVAGIFRKAPALNAAPVKVETK